jgi:putative transposase
MIELTNQGMSQRTACKLASIARSTATRKSTMPEDKPLREKINFLPFKYKRAGYRVIHEYLKREGININHKKMFRIWTEDGHTQPRRRKKKRAKGEGPMPFSALYKGHIWSLDFVADKTTTGLELRYLTVIDDFIRECIGIEVRRSMKAVDVINSLRRLMKRHGQPAWIRTDNGMEFAAQALQNWLSDRYVKRHFIAPGSPWQVCTANVHKKA